MPNDELKHLLSRYIDGQLDESERLKVEQLLSSDAEYAEYYRQLKKLGEMADDFELDTDDKYWSDQKDAVLRKIDKAESTGVTPLPVKRTFFSQYKWLAVAASIAVVAVISIFEVKYDQPEKMPFAKKQPIFFAPSPERDRLEIQIADLKSEDELPTTTDKDAAYGEQPEKIEARPKISVPLPVSQSLGTEISAKDEVGDGGQMETVDTDDPTPIKAGYDEADIHKEKWEVRSYAPQEESVMESVVAAPTGESELSYKKSETAYFSTQSMEEHGEIILDKSMPETEQILDKTIRVSADRDIFDKFRSSSAVKIVKENAYDTLEFGVDSPKTQEYDLWLARFDSLDNDYQWWLSDHKVEALGKSRQPVPPRPPVEIVERMAEICYRVGLLTPYKEEKSLMLQRLEQLKSDADSGTIFKINQYLSEIE